MVFKPDAQGRYVSEKLWGLRYKIMGGSLEGAVGLIWREITWQSRRNRYLLHRAFARALSRAARQLQGLNAEEGAT